MFTEEIKKEFYQALIDKNTNYEGIFFVAVKTTGIFCRSTCPARKPKFENCEFYKTAQEALLASFRPCIRCRPLLYLNQASDLVQTLVDAINEDPAKRWKNSDFKELAIDASTVRRQFQKRFGMTFVQYARARRMDIANKEISEGKAVIDAQLNIGYESGSGFRDAFSKIMGSTPSNFSQYNTILKASWIDTPLGPMLAIADEEALYLLEFFDRRALEQGIKRLRLKTNAVIIPGNNEVIISIEKELKSYFVGALREFKTSIRFFGTPFQKSVWAELLKIPYGQTRSYGAQAVSIGKQKAVRAVANTNGLNQIAILVPCHRIINSNGNFGGYAGGLARKKWLIEHERQNSSKTHPY